MRQTRKGSEAAGHAENDEAIEIDSPTELEPKNIGCLSVYGEELEYFKGNDRSENEQYSGTVGHEYVRGLTN